MSVSSKNNDDGSRIVLPVFVSPMYLSFALNKRKSYITIFNPYENDAQFKILTTSPQRFDLNISKGSIKPSRCIDISIRLLPDHIDDLPEPELEPQTIDSFRITLQVGNLRGNKAIQVLWCADAEHLENSDNTFLQQDNSDKKTPPSTGSSSTVYRTASKSALATNRSTTSSSTTVSAPIRPNNRNLQNSRMGTLNGPRDHSNINLVCTVCALLCVLVLFMPLSIDYGLCSRAIKAPTELEDNSLPEATSWLAMAQKMLAVSYEMKIGCSFALGLFTYRLISTLPD